MLLSLQSVPRDDSSISLSDAVFGFSLVLPCEFLDSPELPTPEYLRQIQQIIKTTPVAPPHHKSAPLCAVPAQVLPSLLRSTHVFVREDTSKPPLSLLYRDSYMVVSCSPKNFSLQVGFKTDFVSVDRLKLVLSEFPITAQEPPCCGGPLLPQKRPASLPLAPVPPPPNLPTPHLTATSSRKTVRFSPPASVQPSAQKKHLSSLQSLKMLGAPMWRSYIIVFHFWTKPNIYNIDFPML